MAEGFCIFSWAGIESTPLKQISGDALSSVFSENFASDVTQPF